ncbi:DUF4149 domain-containing protein [Alicyclobacillus ferrooxydans]|uniref:TMEM205-like domain-containing protein n=1 Tax=Alicyclobacillus ferrooxydans TaxID=471514 RepID=A0A0P9D715_9BACL|nr:DUF4149 domain-containing protein [Alicyclobacillus ferrooxydans]KPV45140.1 hypothetical protein AN477_03945 [Alicyclobacillus ferrooxydans]
MSRFVLFLLLLVESLWLGSSIYFSAFAANELFAQLSENAAAAAVGALFPTYFLLSGIFSVLTVVLYVWLRDVLPLSRKSAKFGMGSAIVGAVFALINLLYMLPHIQRIERVMGPIQSASAAMVQKFGMWHGISMLFDLIMMVCAFLVLISMAVTLPLRLTR